jgi:hypothetical protein
MQDTGSQEARTAALEWTRHCLADPDFAGVRESEALARLPERERRAWQQFWDVVRDRLTRARRAAMPTKESPAE